MDLREYIRTVRHRWMSATAVLMSCVALAALYTWQSTPEYSSTARLFVATSDTDASEAYQGGLYATQRVTSYADIVQQSDKLATEVAGDLGEPSQARELLGQVRATVVANTVNLEITAIDMDPIRARDIAQAYAQSLSELVADLETPEGQTNPLITATIVDDASVPMNPVSPRPLNNLGLGVVVGLVLGLAVALLRDFLDNTINTSDDAAQITPAPILGYINNDLSAVRTPPSEALETTTAWAEAFRVLRTNMQFIEVDNEQKVFVVTSSLPGEGKTTTATNLALTLALTNQRVALIECDLRRPLIARRLGLDEAVGTTSVLIGKVLTRDALQRLEKTGLYVLACGSIPPNPAELLQSRAMETLIEELRSEFDVVIIDAPPLLPVTDAAILAAQADGAFVVVRHGKTTKEQLAHAVERLDAVDAKQLGLIFNMVPTRRGGSTYSYSYTYDYKSSPLAVQSIDAAVSESTSAGRRAAEVDV